ncbi:hypothetical protein CRE_09362 [Caenorhabditis remanei]|uniref:Uncharacterized protein n=1 Tax=Caenorhabditis remanei TaxID=31234 RepID=E3LIE7_CAERE|nr:hypothetical protein CRE_09362 [Caenorhabditis remanei]
MKTLLFFLFILAACSAVTKHFRFDTTAVCRDRVTHSLLEHWCYRVEIWHASTLWNEKLFEMKDTICSEQMTDTTLIEGNHTYPSAYGNDYQIYTKIYHTCTIDGRELMRKRQFSYIRAIEDSLNYTLTVDLFDDGTEIKETEATTESAPDVSDILTMLK